MRLQMAASVRVGTVSYSGQQPLTRRDHPPPRRAPIRLHPPQHVPFSQRHGAAPRGPGPGAPEELAPPDLERPRTVTTPTARPGLLRATRGCVLGLA